jgi:hypothetical protein
VTNPLRSVQDYELFLYTLGDQFPALRQSTVTLVHLGATLARVTGELVFDRDIRIVVRERLIFDRLPAVIDWYGYEVWQGDQKLCWYDPQPHPGERCLESTYPHHKHIPPDMKHNRIPAPDLSFDRPNLPVLIREVERLIVSLQRET